MKETIVVWFWFLLGWYGKVGVGVAILAVIWVSILSTQASEILARGNIVKIKGGPTFTDYSQNSRMTDWFIMCRGFGTMVLSFLFWPIALWILFTDPKWWYMIEEVKKPKT